MSVVLPGTSRNFNSLAEEAASLFLEKEVPLTDAVATIAIREKLNPLEVKRLTEKANVVATVRMLHISQDKKVTFDLAKYSDVLNKTHSTDDIPEDKPVVKVAEKKRQKKVLEFSDIFPCSQKKTTHGGTQKTAAEMAGLFKRKREKEKLLQEKIACEMQIKDGIDYLASEFMKLNGPDFSKFASEAITLYGIKCKPILDSLANYLQAVYDHEKTANYVINNLTPIHNKFASVYTNVLRLVAIEERFDDYKDC